MKERLLFVAAGLAQTPSIRDARYAGHYVIAMDGDSNAPGLAEADESHVANILDPQEIMRVCRKTGANGIVSVCCDAAMDSVAEACRVLGLPGVSPEVVRVSRSKLLQREAIRSAGLLTPDFTAATTWKDALAAWDTFQAEACVVKPIDASGSRGVSFVDHRDNVRSAFELARQNSRSGGVLVESFVDGTEYSVEAWVVGVKVHVLATSEKVRTHPPYLLDRQVHFPDSLCDAARQRMITHAVRAIEVCGFHDCPVHLECIESAKGPMVVELAARGAGFKVFTEILPKIKGISTTRASIQAALGVKPDLTLNNIGSAASLTFIDPVPGLLKAVHGIKAARALPGVEEVAIYVRPGQRLQPLRSGADRAGHILVYDPDPGTCRETAREALAMIRLEVESAALIDVYL